MHLTRCHIFNKYWFDEKLINIDRMKKESIKYKKKELKINGLNNFIGTVCLETYKILKTIFTKSYQLTNLAIKKRKETWCKLI